MANVNAANGFTPLRHLTGGVIRPNEYPIASAYAANIASGDLVTLHTDGTIIRGTAGGTALGVFYGVEYIATPVLLNLRKFGIMYKTNASAN